MDWIYGKRKKVVLLCCAALLLIGTFFDLQISQVLFHKENPFALFFASFGEYPGAICTSIGCGLMFAAFDKNKKLTSTLLCLLSVLLVLFSTLCASDIYENTPQIFLPGLIAELAIDVVLLVASFKFADRSDKVRLRRLALVFCLSGILATVVVNVVKNPWSRPRYRSIVITEGLAYQPWYHVGNASRDAFVAAGLKAGEFRSFPSGHAASAATMLSLVLLPMAFPQLKGKEKILTVIAFLIPALVMIARIMSGAHFLSDVTMGFLIQYGCLLLVTRLTGLKPLKTEQQT